ncbi:multidrug effflux MFS transporter [Urechidicola sp. KH5]
MQKKQRSQFEFISLMAFLMAIVALAIDALLPALGIIGNAIGTHSLADNQLLITMIFLGLGIGSLLFGPLSDSLGRKPIVFLGLLLFVVASLICIYADSLAVMIFGRILQGIALSAPRTVSIAIVRDSYEGDYMARIMSFITVIFILVPMVAPAFGSAILNLYNWQAIFYVQIVFAILIGFWFWKRQPETLSKLNRIGFTPYLFIDGTKELLKHKTTIGYTLISGFITGSFMVYLSTSQQIFELQYGMLEEFPYIFAGLAFSVGLATFLNGSWVLKIGMRRLVNIAAFSYLGVSLLYILLYPSGANPPITILLTFFGLQFFSVGFLFGNLRSLAMQPVGHIAGIAAAITGFISTLMAVPISALIGMFVVDSVLPLFIGFSVFSFLTVLILWYLGALKASVTKA